MTAVKRGTRVQLVKAHGYPLPVPVPGTVEQVLPGGGLEVLHDAHDCDPTLPVGTMGIDFWPSDEVEVLA